MPTKIKITDSVQDILWKLSEGNPGALTVCMQMLQDTETIDPDNALGGLGALLTFDSLGLYGSEIWMLYKDVCKEDLATTLAVMRGWQLGFLGTGELNRAVQNYGQGIDVPAICLKVAERLPRFQFAHSPQKEARP